MFPAPFEYYRPERIDEATALLEEHATEDPAVLAGGQSLLPRMKNGVDSPSVLIDIGRIPELDRIDHHSNTTVIGSTTTHATVAASDAVQQRCPAVADAVCVIGDRQIRNMGTIGGNLVQAAPASDPPAAVLAAGATLHISGPHGERTVAIDEFFQADPTTVLDRSELLTAIEIPSLDADGGSSYRKYRGQETGYPLAGVAARLQTTDGTITSVRVAATGAFDHARRLTSVEAALEGTAVDTDGLAETASECTLDGIDACDLRETAQASSSYRGRLVTVCTRRAIEQAIQRTGVYSADR